MSVVLRLPSGEKVALPCAECVFGREGSYLRVNCLTDGVRLVPLDASIINTLNREHARFRFYDGVLFVQDLYSANGTFLNGLPLRPLQPAVLEDGDRLRLGALRLTVQMAC